MHTNEFSRTFLISESVFFRPERFVKITNIIVIRYQCWVKLLHLSFACQPGFTRGWENNKKEQKREEEIKNKRKNKNIA